MKRIVIICCVLLLGSCSAQKKYTEVAGKIYTNPDVGLSLEIPQNWQPKFVPSHTYAEGPGMTKWRIDLDPENEECRKPEYQNTDGCIPNAFTIEEASPGSFERLRDREDDLYRITREWTKGKTGYVLYEADGACAYKNVHMESDEHGAVLSWCPEDDKEAIFNRMVETLNFQR